MPGTASIALSDAAQGTNPGVLGGFLIIAWAIAFAVAEWETFRER